MTPRFRRDMSKHSCLIKGRRNELMVEVIGTPNPTIEWKRGRDMLKNSERVHCISDWNTGIHKLVLDDVNMGDKGYYTVSASNTIGYTKSSAYLHVTAGPPILRSVCENYLRIVVGEPLLLYVAIAEHSDEMYNVCWFKDGAKIGNKFICM